MSTITLKVNGATRTVDVEPLTPLLYVLRNDLGLEGPKFGCGLGQCGACTVIVNGVATRSCITQTSAVKGDITTLEGLAVGGKLHPLQQAWIDEQVPQCGFCQNGQIMTAKALLDKNPHPTDAQIREGMARTLCRCMTYYRVQAAIRRGSHELRREFLKSSGVLVTAGAEAWIPAGAQSAGPYRPRLQTAGFMDRDSPGQHRDVLRRQDRLGQGTGTAFRQMMSDELDIATTNDMRHGQHRQHRR